MLILWSMFTFSRDCREKEKPKLDRRMVELVYYITIKYSTCSHWIWEDKAKYCHPTMYSMLFDYSNGQHHFLCGWLSILGALCCNGPCWYVSLRALPSGTLRNSSKEMASSLSRSASWMVRSAMLSSCSSVTCISSMDRSTCQSPSAVNHIPNPLENGLHSIGPSNSNPDLEASSTSCFVVPL